MTCDIAVIGAGPAGSVAAAALARRGARVVLVDGSHPREKPCGGGLTGRALALIDELVPPHAVPSVPVRSARFIDPQRTRHIEVDLTRRENTLRVYSRAALDGALLDAAIRSGAVHVAEQVADVVPGRPHTIVTRAGRRLAAPFLVGADGANSLVRRRVASPFRRDQLSMATGVFAHGATSDEILLEMIDRPAGYIWSFPRPDHLAIGICAQATDTTAAPLRATLVNWLRRTGVAGGARLASYSWPIPSLSAADYDTVAMAADNWLLLGDAAGLVDPITREGIFFAIQSALFAADALATAPSRAGAAYDERVRAEIIAELSIAARLKRGFFLPQFTRLLLDALASSARIRAVMADLAGGTQPYSTLKRRLIGTFELGFAWKWLRRLQRTA